MPALSQALAALWQRNQPLVLERLDLLDHTAEHAYHAPLSPQLRDQALATAHKLAGSLGMFGFHEGTRMAREIELQLESSEALDPVLFAQHTAELRRSITFPSP